MFDLLLTREYLLSQPSLMGETSLFKSSIIENRRKVFSILWKVCKTSLYDQPLQLNYQSCIIVWMGSKINTWHSCFDVKTDIDIPSIITRDSAFGNMNKLSWIFLVISVFTVLILIDRNPKIPSVFTQLLLSFPFGNIIDEASVCRATKVGIFQKLQNPKNGLGLMVLLKFVFATAHVQNLSQNRLGERGLHNFFFSARALSSLVSIKFSTFAAAFSISQFAFMLL